MYHHPTSEEASQRRLDELDLSVNDVFCDCNKWCLSKGLRNKRKRSVSQLLPTALVASL